jgi:hypothetical protein
VSSTAVVLKQLRTIGYVFVVAAAATFSVTYIFTGYGLRFELATGPRPADLRNAPASRSQVPLNTHPAVTADPASLPKLDFYKGNDAVSPIRIDDETYRSDPYVKDTAPLDTTNSVQAPQSRPPAQPQKTTPKPAAENAHAPPANTQQQVAPPVSSGTSALNSVQTQSPSTPDSKPAKEAPQTVQPGPSNQATVPAPSAAPPPAIAKEVPTTPAIPAYLPPRPLKWVEPTPSRSGSETANIALKLSIDEQGHVRGVQFLSDGSKVKKSYIKAATQAAQQWVFEPAKLHGKNVASEDTIVFHFSPRRK